MTAAALKTLLKGLTPPFMAAAYRSIAGRGIRYDGPYESWESARADADGYDDEAIIRKVRDAAAKVRDGAAAYERDSVLFERNEQTFPLLAALLRTAVRNQGKLSVLDFGGSLGSSYFQCRGFLGDLASLHWNVVEQAGFVECGKREFASDQLHFYPDIRSCLDNESPGIAILCSSLPYVRDPYAVLAALSEARLPEIMIDRTHCHDGDRDLFFVQKVPPRIYAASYPCRVFSASKLEAALRPKYELLSAFQAEETPVFGASLRGRLGGWIWTRKEGSDRTQRHLGRKAR
jgi:putative methyltransferase (TIGR04325 family)